MPYTEIHWIKIQVKLLYDHRFIELCDDSEKLLYLGLLILAGATRNKIPNNVKYLKRTLNLTLSEDEIKEKITKLLQIFPKLKGTPAYLKFNNFNKLHNYFRNSQGTPRIEKSRVEENRIDKSKTKQLVDRYFTLKNYPSTHLDTSDYKRAGAEAQKLLIKSEFDIDTALAGLEWIEGHSKKQKWADWRLSTLIKYWPDFMKWHTKSDFDKKWGRDD